MLKHKLNFKLLNTNYLCGVIFIISDSHGDSLMQPSNTCDRHFFPGVNAIHSNKMYISCLGMSTNFKKEEDMFRSVCQSGLWDGISWFFNGISVMQTLHLITWLSFLYHTPFYQVHSNLCKNSIWAFSRISVNGIGKSLN